MKKLTKKQLLRLDELETKARDEFIANSDYNPVDWLFDEEKAEYIKLFDLFLHTLGGTTRKREK